VILVDTSIWIDHLRTGNPKLAALLRNGQVLAHPFVLGELALGNLARRDEILGLIRNLPQVGTATDPEVLILIENHRLFGLGIGFVDAHLLAATALTPRTGLWTHDQRLASVAARLGLAGVP
jgi:predicted nucleic acid-binding protein